MLYSRDMTSARTSEPNMSCRTYLDSGPHAASLYPNPGDAMSRVDALESSEWSWAFSVWNTKGTRTHDGRWGSFAFGADVFAHGRCNHESPKLARVGLEASKLHLKPAEVEGKLRRGRNRDEHRLYRGGHVGRVHKAPKNSGNDALIFACFFPGVWLEQLSCHVLPRLCNEMGIAEYLRPCEHSVSHVGSDALTTRTLTWTKKNFLQTQIPLVQRQVQLSVRAEPFLP